MRSIVVAATAGALMAMMLAPGMAEQVGVAAAVNPAAIGTPPDQAPKTIVIGAEVFQNESIVTDGHGLVQILLADGSSFTVGPNSTMVIDSFVYDPSAGTAEVAATLGRGVFRFIGGAASKQPDGVNLTTPVGTVGIRGGIANLDFSGAVPFHIDMVYGTGVTLSDGTRIIGNLYKSGYSIVIGGDGRVSVQKTPPEWTDLFQAMMTGRGTGSPGGQPPTEVADSLNVPVPAIRNNLDLPGLAPVGGDPASPITITTWAQIDNSGLSGVSGHYAGEYAGMYTLGQISGEFDSVFDMLFGFASRTGTINFYGGNGFESNPLVSVPVAGHSLGSGPATFGWNDEFSVYEYLSGTAALNGMFLNTGQTAGGVAGVFDVTVHGGPGFNLTGAFGGSLVDVGD